MRFKIILVLLLLTIATTKAIVVTSVDVKTQADFDAGTYNLTYYNTTYGAVALNETATAGDYVSKIYDLGSTANFTNITIYKLGYYGVEYNLNENTSKELYVNLSNLLILYHFNNNLQDSSGNNNHASSTSTYAYDAGVYFDALKCDGDDLIDFPNLALSGDFAVEFWFNPSTMNPNDVHSIVSFEGSLGYVRVDIINQHLVFYVYDGTNHHYIGNVSLQTNNWYYVVAQRNGTTYELYLNGTLVGSEVINNVGTSTQSNRICTRATSGVYTYYYYGLIDEFAWYNRVLTEQEIKDRYLRGRTFVRTYFKSCTDSTCSNNFTLLGKQDFFDLSSFNSSQWAQFKLEFVGPDNIKPKVSRVLIYYTLTQQPPIVDLIYPADGSIIVDNFVNITFTITDPDNDVNLSADVYVNNVLKCSYFNNLNSGDTAYCFVDNLAEGTHTITIITSDGNNTATYDFTFEVFRGNATINHNLPSSAIVDNVYDVQITATLPTIAPQLCLKVNYDELYAATGFLYVPNETLNCTLNSDTVSLSHKISFRLGGPHEIKINAYYYDSNGTLVNNYTITSLSLVSGGTFQYGASFASNPITFPYVYVNYTIITFFILIFFLMISGIAVNSLIYRVFAGLLLILMAFYLLKSKFAVISVLDNATIEYQVQFTQISFKPDAYYKEIEVPKDVFAMILLMLGIYIFFNALIQIPTRLRELSR